MTNGQWELEELEAVLEPEEGIIDLYPAGGSMGALDQWES